MSEWLNAVLLGLIEGITEFLPISSTGHLLIAEHWLGARSDLFNIVIQFGAILAVVLIYRQRLWTLASDWRHPEQRDYLAKLAVAFGITAALGFAVTKAGFKLPQEVTPVAWALLIGGVWMLAAESMAARLPAASRITWAVAIAVGLAQVVAAIFPGTSRSGATIFIALLVGCNDRRAATEFAFLVGIPTMAAASGYELLKYLKAGGGGEPLAPLTIAFAVSMASAFIAVRWLLGYIGNHRYTGFAIYRIVVGAVLLLGLV